MGIIGTAYAVLLSFIVVVIWQQYNESDSVASTEAGAVSDLHHLSDALPSPLNVTLKAESDRYVKLMIDVEWPDMQRGAWSPQAQHLTGVIVHQVADVIPRNPAQQNAAASLDHRTHVARRPAPALARQRDGHPVDSMVDPMVRCRGDARIQFHVRRRKRPHPIDDDCRFDRHDCFDVRADRRTGLSVPG
ncbi:MAG: hypothetical protein GIX03_15295 [Candidatus Eremiobacteraeota bacterium]|nr:hypothetical protein [Candidatus Eremiobacteraeota bacterium]MBC5804331.1 hypothetical protein [Candidatus Eremiobacteraeota bacterium]